MDFGAYIIIGLLIAFSLAILAVVFIVYLDFLEHKKFKNNMRTGGLGNG